MNNIIINIILIVFPILVYLVLNCYNIVYNRKIKKVLLIITLVTSLYLFLKYSFGGAELIVFCNIPILICYFKREDKLGLVLSFIVMIFGFLKYDMNIFILLIKYLLYYIAYIVLYKSKDFNYLFLKISGIIQGFFITFEYFVNYYGTFYKILGVMFYVLIIYALTYLSLYLFKLADSVSELYVSYNKVIKDNRIKDSLFKLTHEIKNPLAVCKGYLDMINFNDINKSSKYVNIIKSEIDRSLNVIADFTDYSKIKINKELMDLGMLVDQVYDSFKLLSNGKNIRLICNNRYDDILIMGDYERLKQVFINIIKNSIESINNDGIISIDVMKNNNYVFVVVKDNGVGMDEEELSRIKEIFFTTKKDGTGLGVALSNEIVSAHNGQINYYSEKNKGTKCVVQIPL